MSVTLQKISRQDLKYFYTWASDQEVAKAMAWNAYTSLHEAEKFLEEVAEPHPWFKKICYNGVPVGSITLTPGREVPQPVELSWVMYLQKTFWEKVSLL